jgi:8-oxo-dGTP diphosphatase
VTGTWLPRDQYIKTLPKATAYACLYVTDESGNPLMLRSSRNASVWQNPGGNMDPGETPWETAVREYREETGLVVTERCPLILTHFMTPVENWPHMRVGFVFDGGTLTTEQLGGIVLDPDEHCEWDVRPMAQWRQEMEPRHFARLEAVDAARRSGVAGYLETRA